MKELLKKLKDKAKACGNKTKIDRARKGAYVDCIVEIKQALLIQRVVLNEADFVITDSINDEPEPLWKSHDLELASSEVELPCHCGKLMEESYAPCCSLSCWCEMFEGQGN